MQDALLAVAPCLRGQKLLQQQSCYLPSSADQLPVIGKTALLHCIYGHHVACSASRGSSRIMLLETRL
jgi:hypothetical protein